VFDLDGDASGLAVAEAARVMATAGSGQTHVSRSVLDQGLDIGRVRPLGVRALKGLPHPTELFCLTNTPSDHGRRVDEVSMSWANDSSS
jgi:class 3 adenylate cyclase